MKTYGIAAPMHSEPTPYLRLSQFLDLESRWICAGDKAELCHRICQTIVLLLRTPAVSLGLQDSQGRYEVVASEGAWGEAQGSQPATGAQLLRKAQETGLAQLKSIGDSSIGIFPFRVDNGTFGCLHVKLDRPIFQGAEVSFLRFLASLTAIVLAGGMTAPVEPSARNAEREQAPSEENARRYVAMAVHDLRNPLHVVAGYATMLADGTLGGLAAPQQDAVAAINRQVGVVLTVIDQLIDLDRLTDRDRDSRNETFELRSLFSELAETRFAHAKERIQWPGAETAFEFTTDRQRMFSVIQNLVDNSMKHGGGAPVTIECTRHNKALVVQVSDRGPGLDPALRAAINADSPTNVLSPRSGLGLYAVACYVATLGGTLEAADREGGGTRITVRIPAAQTARRS